MSEIKTETLTQVIVMLGATIISVDFQSQTITWRYIRVMFSL